MLAVAVARSSGESQDDDIRTEAADDVNDIAKNFFPRPLPEGFFGVLGESEIDRAREKLFTSVDAAGRQEFLRSNDSQRVALFGTDQVLSAFAACEGKIGGSNMAATREIRQKGRIFIVGMRSDHHHAARGGQAFQALMNIGFARDVFLGLKRREQAADQEYG